MSNFGAFSNESLRLYEEMVSLGWDVDFSESEGFYDFTRCVRADGTAYGTKGKCKKGKQVDELKKAIDDAHGRELKARKEGDQEGAKKAMREHMDLVKKLDSMESKAKEQKLALKRLQDRLDEAASIKEQQRISAAIRDLKGRMEADFSEEILDFARCQRADGSYYGTRGKCKQGKEVAAREKPATRAEMQKINEKEAKRIAKARAKTPKLKKFSHDSLAKYNMTPEQETKLKRSTYFKQVVKRLSEIKGELKVARNKREVKELTERHNSLVEAAENQIRKVKLEG